MKSYDLLIIGSGIVGSALSFYSSLQNKKVLVLEKNFAGYNSSGNAQGGLAPYLGNDLNVKKLHQYSYDLHTEFKDNYKKYTKINPQYNKKFLIHILKDENEKKDLILNGFDNEDFFDLNELQKLEPKLKKADYGAIIFDKYMEVDSFNLTNSFKDSSMNLGAEYINFNFSMDSLNIKDQIIESININNEELKFQNIAITAGPWTKDLAKNNDEINVKPLKGQLLKVETDLHFENSFSWSKDYATKKYDNLLWIGTTEEDVNFQEGTTEEGRKEILDSFNEIFTGFEKLKIIDHTACFRPYSKNNTPIIKKSSKYSNLFYGTGAGRNGIKLGPAMGMNIYKKIFN
jgi:glycine/D-amino acid oxidase-like deaminating enzyme